MELNVSPTYDANVLIAIAASLGGGVLVGVITSYPVQLGVFAGSLVATVFIYDAVTVRNISEVRVPDKQTNRAGYPAFWLTSPEVTF